MDANMNAPLAHDLLLLCVVLCKCKPLLDSRGGKCAETAIVTLAAHATSSI